MKSLTLAIFFLFSLQAVAQENPTARLNRYFSFHYQQAVIQHDSISKVVVYAQGNRSQLLSQLALWNIENISQLGPVLRFELPAIRLLDFASNPGLDVMEEGKKSASELDDSARFYSRIDSVYSGLGNLSSAYTGKGVIMGIIDSGVDYTHGDFRNKGDSLTRILRFYDYNVTPPQGYSSAQINQNLSAPTLPIDDSWHGTHVAGVAVGNGNAYSRFRGMAPEASMLVSDLTPDEFFDDIISSADSMFALASSLRKPCVINLSLGSNYGPHDGSDSYSLALEALAKADSGRAFVIAAGNSTTLFPHLSYSLSNDTNFTYLTASTAYPVYTQTYISSSQTTTKFRISLDTLGTGSKYRRFASSPFRTISNIPSTGVNDTLKHPNQTPYCVVTTYASPYTQNRVLIEHVITYLNPTGLKVPLYRFEATGTGSFHLWTEDGRMVTNTTTIGRAFPDSSKYRRPDDRNNMAGYFNCARDLIAVANFANRAAWIPCGSTSDQSLSQVAGTIAFNSSYGPNVDGFQKPDIGGAGDNTMGARSSNVPTPDSRATIGCFHRRARGTSNAAAVITGALCLYFQANPQAGWYTVKKDLTQTAIRDGFTGPTPNSLWGYGKLNALAFVQAGENRSCRNLQGISRIQAKITSSKDSICPGEPLVLNASGKGSGLTYFWIQGGNTASTTTVQKPGNYQVVVTDALGCSDTSASKTIFLKPSFVGTISGSTRRVGSRLQISTNAGQWEWQINGGSGFTTLASTMNQGSITANQIGQYRVALFHPQGCTTYSDTFVVSAPPTGQYDWVLGLNTNSKARITHLQAFGNQLFLAGIYEDSLMNGTSTFRATGAKKTNAFVLSTDLLGNQIWFQNCSGAYDEEITSMEVSPSGKLWITGKFKSSFTYAQITTSDQPSINQNCFLMELDRNSGIDLKRMIFPGNSNRRVVSMVCDSSENIYVGGWHNGNLFNRNCAGDLDLFLAKMDTNLQFIWSKSDGGVGVDYLTQLYYQNGCIWGSGYVGAMRTPGALGLQSSGTYNGFLAQFNGNTGTTLWVENIGGTGLEYGWGITGNHGGKIWVTGSFTGDLRIKNFRFSNANSEDFFVAELQENTKNWNWIQRSTLGGMERILSIQFAQNQLFLGGYGGTQFQYDQVNTSSPNGLNGLIGSIDTTGGGIWWIRANPSVGNYYSDFQWHQNKYYFGGYQSGTSQYGTINLPQNHALKAIFGSALQTNNNITPTSPVFRNSESSIPYFPNYQWENGILTLSETAPSFWEITEGTKKYQLPGSRSIPISNQMNNIQGYWKHGGVFDWDVSPSEISKNILPIQWNGTEYFTNQPVTWNIFNVHGQLISQQKNQNSMSLPEVPKGIYLLQILNEKGEIGQLKLIR